MALAGESIGDCVDCNACVAVCPMGIDIRDGQQLECITCALCIDACDGVMDKLGRERGLISYATLNDYNANMALATAGGTRPVNPALVRDPDGRLSDKVAHISLRKLLRPRTLIYLGVWSAIGLFMVYALLTRNRLELNVLHDRNPQFVVLSDGSIRNGYTLKLLNMVPRQRNVRLSLAGSLPAASMSMLGSGNPEGGAFDIELEPDRLKTIKVFVRQAAGQAASPLQEFKFIIEDSAGGERADYTATFNAPETAQ